jgi:hypothetical protein
MHAVIDRRALPALALFLVGATLPLSCAIASPLSGSLALGAEYDSNVSIDETDINAHQGDAAALVAASVGITAVDSKSVRLDLGYSYDGTFRQDIKDYDLDIHQGTASLAVKRGKVTFGMDYRFAHVRLDGDSFLNLQVVAPSVSSFLTRNLYARAGYSRMKKAYRTSVSLDAKTQVMTLDIYRFFARRKGYVALGLRHDDENASGPEYDYHALQASARALIPFRVAGAPMKLRLSYAYGERDYSGITPSINAERSEKRSTFGAGLDIPITRRLMFKPALRYVDRQSNVPIFNYREHRVSAMLQYKL